MSIDDAIQKMTDLIKAACAERGNQSCEDVR